MFNDRYGLTTAVLEGRKAMTRRIIDSKTSSGANDYVQRIHGTGLDFLDYLLEHSRYKVGEEVAIAQKYSQIFTEAYLSKRKGSLGDMITGKAWDNKMFVQAKVMPHRIRITDIRVEHLQDITDEDCMREGIEEYASCCECGADVYTFFGAKETYYTPREAFAALIDKVSGKGTWDKNPCVFAYSFELVK